MENEIEDYCKKVFRAKFNKNYPVGNKEHNMTLEEITESINSLVKKDCKIVEDFFQEEEIEEFLNNSKDFEKIGKLWASKYECSHDRNYAHENHIRDFILKNRDISFLKTIRFLKKEQMTIETEKQIWDFSYGLIDED